jgi:DNA-damage-inducible protein J
VIITALGVTLTTQSRRESPIFTSILPTAHLMANTDIVRARIDRHITEEATNVLAQMGCPFGMPSGCCLPRIAADKALPFDVNRAVT